MRQYDFKQKNATFNTLFNQKNRYLHAFSASITLRMKMYTVYIADDHNIVAKGIATLIAKFSEVEKVEIFPNGKELYNACCNIKPDVVFLDMGMPIWDGKTALIELKKKFPTLRCIMLSMYNEKEIINDCIHNGASGYLNKDCSEIELRQAIIAKDEIYYSKKVLTALNDTDEHTQNSEIFPLKEQLSKREIDILTLLCEGMNPKEIAKKLFLSIRTVETHKTNIMTKFEVNSVGKLISLVLKNNVIK